MTLIGHHTKVAIFCRPRKWLSQPITFGLQCFSVTDA